MANNVNDVLNVFKSWNGAREGGSTHKNILAIYNNHQPLARNYRVTTKDSWCATSVSAAFIKAGAVDALKGGTECSCGKMVELAKRNGLWDGNWKRTPAVGDIVMYDWNKKHGWPEHVGIVTSVNGSSFTVIEGNKNDAVGYRTVSTASASIAGFIRPAYGAAQPQQQPQPKTQPKPSPKPSGNENVRKAQHFANDFVDAGLKEDGFLGPKTKKAMIKVLQKCLNLDYRKHLAIDGIALKHTYDALGNHYVKRGEHQYLVTFVECALSALGYNVLGIETPGIFGAGLEYAVKQVQKRGGLNADGVAGHDTLRYVISLLS